MKLTNYTASNFEGKCIVDAEFAPLLDQMNAIAVKHQMTVIVTSSHRQTTHVPGAIVTPAKMSNHLVGHAIDCNLRHADGFYYNSTKMGDGTGRDELFLEDVDRNTDLRWGQSFSTPDSVHLDDAINIKRPAIWHQKFNELNG